MTSGHRPPSSPRGFSGFCLMAQVTTGLIRSIRIIRGRKKERKTHPLAYCPPGRCLVVCHINRGRCPRLLKVVPSRHRSACGMLVMRLPILIGHDVAHRYKKSSPRWEDCLYHCSRYSKRETSLLNDYAKLLMCLAKLDFRFAALFL